jgi:hypothetical protein
VGLQAQGIPSDRLRELRPGRSAPPRTALIVVTATVRRQLGVRLAADYAPALIASFGSGTDRVEVRELTARGTAPWRTLLREDYQQRRESSTELLTSDHITTAGSARRDLAGGQVDDRLLVTIAGIAALDPLRIAAFTDAGPGASRAVSPLRGAELAPPLGDSRAAAAAFTRALLSFLRAQRPPFAPLRYRSVRLGRDGSAISVVYAAPSPLGLLTGALPGAGGS